MPKANPFAWDNLPPEMRALDRWAVATCTPVASHDAYGNVVVKPDKRPYTVLNDGSLMPLSVKDTKRAMPFYHAAMWVHKYGDRFPDAQIGFILGDDDPFTCIDLDVKDASNERDPAKWTTPGQYDLFCRIMDSAASYTEISAGGLGAHVWLKGSATGPGVRRDGVELYSRQRFIICTGNVVKNVPIAARPEFVEAMRGQMGAISMAGNNHTAPGMNGTPAPAPELIEIPATRSDYDVLETGARAENGETFKKLMRGEWRELNRYPSQSEADFALLNLLCFYSESNSQVRRLFRLSGLGQRGKAQRDNYLDPCIRKYRREKADKKAIDDSMELMSLENAKRVIRAQSAELINHITEHQKAEIENNCPVVVSPATVTLSSVPSESLQLPSVSPAPLDDELTFPPGSAGEYAKFIYNASPHPVKEVSICSTLGLIAGICGKSYVFDTVGLNLYLFAIGDPGIGKDMLGKGISLITSQCDTPDVSVSKHFKFNWPASAPGLLKMLVDDSSFTLVTNEFGKRLPQFCAANANPTQQGFYGEIVTQYSKSDIGSTFGGMIYSDSSKNITSTGRKAFSLLSESTPESFYEALSSDMANDGLLSRFSLFEYTGKRTPLNRNRNLVLPDDLKTRLSNVALNAKIIEDKSPDPVVVGMMPDVDKAYNEFEDYCTAMSNDDNLPKPIRSLWIRVSVKTMKIASGFAVLENPVCPIITWEQYEWARNQTVRDVNHLAERFTSGTIGFNDETRDQSITDTSNKYLKERPSKGYGHIPDNVYEARIIPRRVLYKMLGQRACFYAHKLGKNRAIELALQTAISVGTYQFIDKSQMEKDYGYSAYCYRILDTS